MTIEELNQQTGVLRRLRVDLPEDIEAEEARSREFSKGIKKRCAQRMRLSELLDLNREALERYFVITPEMIMLQDYVAKA